MQVPRIVRQLLHRRIVMVAAVVLLVIAAIYVLINFGVDLLYAIVDPRVKI